MEPVPQMARHGHLIHHYREMPPEKRPQDPTGDGGGWTFKTAEHGGEYPDAMPQAILATDTEGRRCTYVALAKTILPEGRPQDPTQDGKGWSFRTREHGGEYPDHMPQAIIATRRRRAALHIRADHRERARGR
jgi:hypothetical protein